MPELWSIDFEERYGIFIDCINDELERLGVDCNFVCNHPFADVSYGLLKKTLDKKTNSRGMGFRTLAVFITIFGCEFVCDAIQAAFGDLESHATEKDAAKYIEFVETRFVSGKVRKARKKLTLSREGGESPKDARYISKRRHM